MHAYEHPTPGPADPPEASGQPADANLLRSQAEMLLGLSDLIEHVHATDQPERADSEFEFFADLLPRELELPASITDYCGTSLESIHLSLSQETDTDHIGGLELRFTDKFLYISRSRRNPGGEAPDAVLVDGEAEPHLIEHIPRRDINELVLQLLTGHHVGSPEELERIDVFSPDSCAVLLDALPDIAHSKFTSEQHRLLADRSLAWVMESSGAEERLLTCRFAYETAVPGRYIVALVDLQHGLQVSMQTQENGIVTPYIPDEGDLTRMQEVIGELTRHYSPADISTDPAELETLAPDNMPEIDF